MHLKSHLLFGITFALLLVIIAKPGPLELAVFMLVTLAVDIDHLIAFLMTGRKLTYQNYMEDLMQHFTIKKQRLYIMHKVEFPLFLLFLSSIDRLFYFAFLGVVFHLLLDIYVYARFHKSFSKLKTFFYLHDLYCWIRRTPAY